jgi:hypothetical protein
VKCGAATALEIDNQKENDAMVLMISYDLNGHERPAAYTAVKNAIENNATDWKRPLYSQWLVETTESSQAWADRLTPVIDQNDKLFITRIQQPYQGWLPKAIWEWLRPRL